MKTLRTTLSALLLVSAFSLVTWAQGAKSSAKPEAVAKPAAKPAAAQTASNPAIQAIEKRKPRLPEFKPQQPVRIQLENGMVIFLQEDHELPFIAGTVTIRGGAIHVPADKAGMNGLYGQVWRTGGTKDKTGDQLDDFLEARAAHVEAGGGTDSSTVSFDCLKNDFDDVFKVFVDVLKNPDFRQDKLDLAKQQASTSISRRNEDPGAIIGREIRKIGYGADNPYVRQAEYWTINAITRDDLVAFHKQTVHPNNMLLGLVGDFDAKAMEARLRQEFGGWAKGPGVPKPRVAFKDPKPNVYFIEKEDVNQSQIQLVTLGLRKDDPDYYAINVMNEAFGGGFAARLFSNVRSAKGLAYSVGGGIGTEFDRPGLFRLVVGTKSETTGKAIDALYEEIDKLHTQPITGRELDLAKANILNSFVFNFDSKSKVLDEKETYEYYGYPLDRLEKFRAGIEKVTLDDVQRVVNKYVERKKFALLVVGHAADFDKPLSRYGTVTPIDITIPTEPPGKASAADEDPVRESNAEGKTLIAKVVTASGGAELLGAIKAMQVEADTVANTPQGEITLPTLAISVYPDKSRVVMQAPFGEIVTVSTAQSAFRSMGGQTQDMPAALREESQKGNKRDLIWVTQHANDPKFLFRTGGTVKVGDADTTILDINADGVGLRWFVDGQGHVVKTAYRSVGMQGPTMRETEFSDFRATDGLTLPFKRVVRDNGQISATVTVKSVKINPEVPAGAFEKQ
ncbi:MAG: insulinase family protein [Acidobacteriales bacterium]|nr:insulinase family protein [Terriglobales bacterium]